MSIFLISQHLMLYVMAFKQSKFSCDLSLNECLMIYSLFKLPCRSAIWLPALTSPESGSMFASFDGLFPSSSLLPNLQEAVSIITPLILDENPNPKIEPKKRKTWTATERVTASNATHATSVEHLGLLVCLALVVFYIVHSLIHFYQLEDAHKGGVCKQDSYVRLPHSVFDGSVQFLYIEFISMFVI